MPKYLNSMIYSKNWTVNPQSDMLLHSRGRNSRKSPWALSLSLKRKQRCASQVLALSTKNSKILKKDRNNVQQLYLIIVAHHRLVLRDLDTYPKKLNYLSLQPLQWTLIALNNPKCRLQTFHKSLCPLSSHWEHTAQPSTTKVQMICYQLSNKHIIRYASQLDQEVI